MWKRLNKNQMNTLSDCLKSVSELEGITHITKQDNDELIPAVKQDYFLDYIISHSFYELLKSGDVEINIQDNKLNSLKELMEKKNNELL